MWCTYLGGSDAEVAGGLCRAAPGQLVIAATTASTDLAQNLFENAGAGEDGYLASFESDDISWAARVGTAAQDGFAAVECGLGRVNAVGATSSGPFGGDDAILFDIDPMATPRCESGCGIPDAGANTNDAGAGNADPSTGCAGCRGGHPHAAGMVIVALALLLPRRPRRFARHGCHRGWRLQ